jgi:hypothetical protein
LKRDEDNNLINFESDNDSPPDPAEREDDSGSDDDENADTNFYKPAAQRDHGIVGCSTRRRRQDWRLKTLVGQDRDRDPAVERVVVDL